MKFFFFGAFISAFFTLHVNAQSINFEDKIRIAEAYKIAELYGNKLWEEWDKAPFALLLVYDDYEYLLNHPTPTEDFKLIDYDSLLNCNVYYRERIFNTNLLSAFPAVNGLPTIVAGIPGKTGKSSSEWIITILHEHFHQFQYSQPDYYSSVNYLNISGGDQTGMWMLNYPFPYNDEKINEQYLKLAGALLNLLLPFPVDSRLFNRDLNDYLKERKSFKNLLDEKDYKYFSFQLWQEGIARYTEYKIADMLSGYSLSEELTPLKDYPKDPLDKPFAETADELREKIFNQLKGWSLKEKGRLCFYSFGAAEGLLLDKAVKNWRDNYLDNKFFLEKNYPQPDED